MDAIEKIVAQILEKGQAEMAASKEAEMKRIDQEFQEQEEALILQEAALIKKNENQAQKAFKQKQNRQQLDIKQATLNKKQGYLEQLFTEAANRMNEWSDVDFQAFAKQIIVHIPVEGEVVLKLGGFSKGKLTAQWLQAQSFERITISLAEESIPAEGGFVIAKDGIEYNFLFSSLIQEIKKLESFQVAEKLFK